MAEIKNRELSQFSSFLHVDNDNQSIGIASDATPFIGIGTVNPLSKVEIIGNVRVTGFVTATSLDVGTITLNSGVSTSAVITTLDGTNLNYSGIGTINSILSNVGTVTNLSGTGVTYTNLTVTNGSVTNLSGTGVTYTNLTVTNGTVTTLSGADVAYTNLVGTSGTITNLSGIGVTYTNLTVTNGSVTNLTGTAATYTTLNSTNLFASNSYLVTGIVTNISGSTINYSGISTFSGVKIQSGIVTASNSGIVTYYGDGSGLTNVPVAVQIQSEGSVVGSSLTALNFTNINGGISFTPATATINLGQAASGTSNAVQYKNASGIFSGSSNFTFDPNTNIVSIAGTCSATNFNSTSDINLKDNVETISGALDMVSNLRGVNFTWKSNGAPSVGVIAQEVEKVLPQLVTSGDPKTVNYDGIIGVLIQAIKELKDEINNLKQGM